MARRRTYLIQNPYGSEAQRFIATIGDAFGLRPLCLYTDPKARFYQGRRYPRLDDRHVEDSIVVDPETLADRDRRARLVEQIGERFDVRAVIPWAEDTVVPSADLAEALGLGWNAAEVVHRFRDKHDLKSFLRARDVRVPMSRIVATVDDVYGDEVPDRFVIKPNDGSGNVEVSIFDRSERHAVAAKLAASRHTWIMEEFVGGDEYHIDGQVRPDGSVTVLGVFQYQRTSVGACDTAYHAERSVHTDERVFAQCADYARRLLAASELRSSPFHMEVKVDGDGPAMIDIGARLGSEGVPESVDRLHPRRPGMYWVAAHDYLGVPFDEPEVDWSHHDSLYEAFAYGICETHGRVMNVRGMDEVERMPEFVMWNVRPRVGRMLEPTSHLGTMPWMAEFDVYGDLDDVERVIATAQQAVRFNVDPSPIEQATAIGGDLGRRVADKGRWIAHRASESLPRQGRRASASNSPS